MQPIRQSSIGRLLFCFLPILSATLLLTCSNDDPTGPEKKTPVNHAPQFEAVSSQNIQIGDTLELTITATDPDGDTLTFATDNLPDNATLVVDSDSAVVFDFYPDETQSGQYAITLIVSDGELADTTVISIEVTEKVNHAPEFYPLDLGGRNTVVEGDSTSFTISAFDPDGTIPSFWALSMDENMSLVDSGNGTCLFKYAPYWNAQGSHKVFFVASDGELETDLLVYVYVLDGPNHAPEFGTLEDFYEVREGDYLTLYLGIVDLDEDNLQLEFLNENPPSWADFGSIYLGWALIQRPGYDDSGDHHLIISVSDGDLADTAEFTVRVIDYNPPPDFTTVANQFALALEPFELSLQASDPNDINLTISMVEPPLGTSFTDFGDGNATFSFTPQINQVGHLVLTFVAFDGENADTLKVDLTVLPPSDLTRYFEYGTFPAAVGNSWTYRNVGTIAIVDAEMVDTEVWWILSDSLGPLRDRFCIRGDSIFSEAGLELLLRPESEYCFDVPDFCLTGPRCRIDQPSSSEFVFQRSEVSGEGYETERAQLDRDVGLVDFFCVFEPPPIGQPDYYIRYILDDYHIREPE